MIDETKWERKIYELTCISPIHIGNGQVLKPYEYFFVTGRQPCAYFLDHAKWMRFLLHHDLIDDYAHQVLKMKNLKLYSWLKSKQLGSPISLISQISSDSAPIYFVKDSRKECNDIVRQVKKPDGMPYIPGSSLKGAIRSAILFHCIRQHPEAYRSFWPQLQRLMSGTNRKAVQSIAAQLERQAFSLLPQHTKNPSDALQSVMKGISVSDAMLVGKDKGTVILQKYDVSAMRGEGLRTHSLPIFRECIPTGRKLRFSLTLNRDITKLIGIHGADDILQWLRDYLAFGLMMEKRRFGREYRGEFAKSDLADILLGGGTGFFSKTVYYALAPEKEGRKILAGFFDRVLFTRGNCHHHLQKDDGLTPRTLKLAWANSDRWILGLASVKEVSSC